MAKDSMVRTLVNEPFYEALIKVVAVLREQYAPLFFAALVPSTEDTGKFVFLFGTHKIMPDGASPVPELVNLFKALLPEKYQNRIQQITVVKETHPFVQWMASWFRVIGGRIVLDHNYFDNVLLEYAVLFHVDVKSLYRQRMKPKQKSGRGKRRGR